jgi:hypothetical protein
MEDKAMTPFWIKSKMTLCNKEVKAMVKPKRRRTKKVIHYDLPKIPFEIQEKDRGMVVAMVNGQVVAGSHSVKEARDKALELRPGIRREDVVIRYIPKTDADYYIYRYEHIHLSL